MKIVFIKPSMGTRPGRPYRRGIEIEPLEFAILAGLTPDWARTTLYDDRVERLPDDVAADLVGIGVDTFTARRGYDIADGFRARGIPVVIGGIHASLMPDEAARHADSVVLGEADELWPTVVEDCAAGRLAPRYQAPRKPSLRGLRPDRRIFGGKRYVPARLVEFGRGCRNRCKYCAVSRFYGHEYRHRPIAEVLDELHSLRGREVYFADDNIIADTGVAREFLAALAPLRIKWSGQMSFAYTADAGLMDLLAASGCRNLLLGLESLNETDLGRMGKTHAAGPAVYSRGLAALRDRGIRVWGSFMFGFDGDTERSISRTIEFAQREKLFLANCNTLTPCPGTALYEELAAEGRLLFGAWWRDPSYRFAHAVHRPAGMTPDTLTGHCYAMRRRFNSWRSIAARGLDFKANCRDLPNAATYFLYNVVFRREMYRKQGMELGLR